MEKQINSASIRMMILQNLAEAGVPVNNQKLAETIKIPLHKLLRELNKIRAEPSPMIQASGSNGFVFIGDKDLLEALDFTEMNDTGDMGSTDEETYLNDDQSYEIRQNTDQEMDITEQFDKNESFLAPEVQKTEEIKITEPFLIEQPVQPVQPVQLEQMAHPERLEQNVQNDLVVQHDEQSHGLEQKTDTVVLNETDVSANVTNTSESFEKTGTTMFEQDSIELKILTYLASDKKSLMESQAKRQFAEDSDYFDDAIKLLIQKGYATETFMDAFNENVYRITKEGTSVFKELSKTGKYEDEKSIQTPVLINGQEDQEKIKVRKSKGSDKDVSQIDPFIYALLINKGYLSESGMLKVLTSQVTEFSKSVIASRIQTLAELGLISTKTTASGGVKFGISELEQDESTLTTNVGTVDFADSNNPIAVQSSNNELIEQPSLSAVNEDNLSIVDERMLIVEPKESSVQGKLETSPLVAPSTIELKEQDKLIQGKMPIKSIIKMEEIDGLISSIAEKEARGESGSSEEIGKAMNLVVNYIRKLEEENTRWREMAILFFSGMKDVLK